jgi:hypothetical protein
MWLALELWVLFYVETLTQSQLIIIFFVYFLPSSVFLLSNEESSGLQLPDLGENGEFIHVLN